MDVSWTIKKAKHWRNDTFELVLEKTLESPLDCKIKPVNPKGNQSWIFIGRTDAEVETPILWPPDAKSQLIRKDPDAGKDWGQEEKGMTEDETVGWHHWLDGHEFEQALGMVKDREAWHAAVYGVTKSQTWLSKQQPCLTSHNCFFSHHQVPIKRAFVRFCWEKMTNTFWKS